MSVVKDLSFDLHISWQLPINFCLFGSWKIFQAHEFTSGLCFCSRRCHFCFDPEFRCLRFQRYNWLVRVRCPCVRCWLKCRVTMAGQQGQNGGGERYVEFGLDQFQTLFWTGRMNPPLCSSNPLVPKSMGCWGRVPPVEEFRSQCPVGQWSLLRWPVTRVMTRVHLVRAILLTCLPTSDRMFPRQRYPCQMPTEGECLPV